MQQGEIGHTLTPLSPPEAFVGLMFKKRTQAGEYGTGILTFVLKVVKHLGQTVDGVNSYEAQYMCVLNGSACRGERECFNQGDLLTYLLHDSTGASG